MDKGCTIIPAHIREKLRQYSPNIAESNRANHYHCSNCRAVLVIQEID